MARAAVCRRGHTEQKGRDDVERIAIQRGRYAKDLEFGALIQPAARLGLQSGGAVARHGIEINTRARVQPLPRGGAHAPRRVVRTSGGRVGVPVRCASRRGKQEVRVAVDKAGHDHPPGGINLKSAAGVRQVFEATRSAHFLDDAVANQQSAICNYAQFPQLGPAPRAIGTTQRDQLARPPNENSTRAKPQNYCNITYLPV